MNLTALEITYIAGGFGITGTLLGAWITYRFALAISKENIRIIAGAKLRDAFAPTLAEYDLIKRKSMNEINAILERNLPIQAAAIETFRFFVARNKQEAYEKAWQDYHRPSGAAGSVFMLQYIPDTSEPGMAENLFKQRIHAILQFTE